MYRGDESGDGVSLRWSLRGALKETFAKRVFLHPSALLDYRYAAVNWLLQALVFGALMVGTAKIALTVVSVLSNVLGSKAAEATEPGLLMSGVYGVLVLLAIDFGLFLAHWLMHRFPLLWEFHKVHHSAEILTPFTVMRMHPVDLIINSAVTSTMVGVVNGLFVYAYAGPVDELWLIGSNAAVFVFFLGGYHLRHSHVWVMFPRGLREVISSPALHLIHHSTDAKHYDQNFGRMFVWWDRMAGSLYQPTEREEITFGLGEHEQDSYDTVAKLYYKPFVRAAKLLRGDRSELVVDRRVGDRELTRS